MGRLTATIVAAGVMTLLLGCRERAEAVQSEAELKQMVRQLTPAVEQATGLTFSTAPTVLRRTRAQVRDYLIHKFDEELPPGEREGYLAAHRLFGLWPDTLDFREVFLDLLTEQVAGYYDPDSGALFVPTDVDPALLRLTLAHELVHALQDQYANLDSIIGQRRQNDRRMAAQSVLEGQATLAQMSVLMPEQDVDRLPSFYETARPLRRQQSLMPQFARAPGWLREGLIFPYLGGGDFMRWFVKRHPGRQPFDAMPVSTEQILHPERYAAGDAPTALAFTGSAEGVRYEDGLGEFETRLLFVELLDDTLEQIAPGLAAGWDGDRYRVIADGEGRDALVWYSVWDDAAAANRFAEGLQRAWRARRRGDTARRWRVERLEVEGRPAVRLIDAPSDWNGWGAPPEVRVSGES